MQLRNVTEMNVRSIGTGEGLVFVSCFNKVREVLIYFILVSIVSVHRRHNLCTPTDMFLKEVRCHFCVNIYIISIRGAQLTGKFCFP